MLLMRAAIASAAAAMLLAAGALAGLRWASRPAWWMGVMVAGAELMAALTALLAAVLARRTTPTRPGA